MIYLFLGYFLALCGHEKGAPQMQRTFLSLDAQTNPTGQSRPKVGVSEPFRIPYHFT